MTLLGAIAPLFMALGVLAFTRLPAWAAAALALLAMLPGLLSNVPGSMSMAGWLVQETLAGVWLAWQAISVMLAGLFFHAATFRDARDTSMPLDGARLFTLVLIIGPFVESAVGFGVGIVVVLGQLLRHGVAPMTAAILSLFSQTLVPWGAFAVGTLIGAELADVPFDALGIASAWLSVPLLFAWLPFYWRVCGGLVLPGPVSSGFPSRLHDVGWLAFAAALLVIASYRLPGEVALIAAYGIIIVLRETLACRASATAMLDQARRVWPYLLLCAILLLSRVVDPVGEVLRLALIIDPIENLPSWSPFFHPSFWLLMTGLVCLMWRRDASLCQRLRHDIGRTLHTGWRPVLVTLLFVILARWMIVSGSAALIAGVLHEVFGDASRLLTPWMAAVAGFLTGSNAASNAMLMPIQSALVSGSATLVMLTVALQNVAGSAMTALSPARIVFASSLAGGLEERDLYRAALGFALPPLLLLPLTAWVLGIALARIPLT